MRLFFNIFVVTLTLFLSSCKQDLNSVSDEISLQENNISETKQPFNFLPTNTTNAVYKHSTYTLSYNEEYEQAEWVAYFLEENDITNANYKRPLFEVDDEVITGSAHWRNFKNSGYNKGHLLPAGDRRKNFKEYEETFLTSNISPHKYAFNAGVWNRLEQKVRYWAKKYDGIYVVTAGVLSDDLETIGYEYVAVPNYFYKILLTKDKSRMIAFLVPHEDSEKPLYKFVVSVDSIEKLTGLDFFPELDDEIENKLEAQSDYKEWSF